MANDVSYFKVAGDNTTYSFNDADAELQIAANKAAIGTLSNLTTGAQGNLVAAINEVNAAADKSVKRSGTLADGTNLDAVFAQGIYTLSGSNTYTGIPTGLTYGTLLVFRPGTTTSNTFTVQMIISPTYLYIRLYGTSSWYGWRTLQGS